MKSDPPLVSVIMNCYNGERYLREAVDSVLNQTYRNFEIIFWDNQSTDNTQDIIYSYSDDRIKYIYAPTHTLLYEARNYAFEHTNGEFIAFLDVDDYWMPDKLEKQLALFNSPSVGLVAGNYIILSERKNKQWKAISHDAPSGKVLNDILKNYYIGLVTLIVRRSVMKSLDYPCDPRYHVIGDFDLVARLLTKSELGFIQDPIAYYRAHDNNESSKNRLRQVKELETWFGEMSSNKTISSCSNFSCVRELAHYIEGMTYVLGGSRSKALSIVHKMSWGKFRFRLLISILLPAFIIHKLKN